MLSSVDFDYWSLIIWSMTILFYGCSLTYGIFAVGGMVVVGKMLVEYGTCVRI